MKKNLRLLVGKIVILIGFGVNAACAQVGLYSTGPAQDAAFLRFLNVSPNSLEVRADNTNEHIVLNEQYQASPFFAVTTDTPITGKLLYDQNEEQVNVKLAPSEFVTVISSNASDTEAVLVIREEPTDFNALKASVAFYNGEPNCKNAAVGVEGREVFLFENTEVGELIRRAVNPVNLSVQLYCDQHPVGRSLDLGRLESGERYSLFLLPPQPQQNETTAINHPSFFYIQDSVLN